MRIGQLCSSSSPKSSASSRCRPTSRGRFPPWDASRGAPVGIVVLGGAIGPDISAARGTPDLNESAERLTAVADLARRYPSAHIVYSGGNARLMLNGGIEADYAVTLF